MYITAAAAVAALSLCLKHCRIILLLVSRMQVINLQLIALSHQIFEAASIIWMTHFASGVQNMYTIGIYMYTFK